MKDQQKNLRQLKTAKIECERLKELCQHPYVVEDLDWRIEIYQDSIEELENQLTDES